MSLPAGNDIPSDWRSVIAAIPEAEKTPLVRLLLQVIEQQAQRIGFLEAKVVSLEAEIVRLKGGPVKKPPASNSKPSELSKPAKPATEDGKRPGKEKAGKKRGHSTFLLSFARLRDIMQRRARLLFLRTATR